MSAKRELAMEVAKLQKIHAALLTLSSRTDAQRKMDLVGLRRELATQIGAVSANAEKGFLLDADENTARDFRTKLSNMRRAVALHQANFPAARLDEQSFEYRESVKSVRDANADFIQWTEQNLKG